MKIAIHNRKGSFSDRWVTYCEEHNIPYKLVNCYDNDIVRQLKDCNALMWHHHHNNYKDVLAAKSILFSLEQADIKVFPDFNTGWHFDNKAAQKYLLEAINAPLVPSHVFYDKVSAKTWADSTTYPKVFKLKGGAGAADVRLAENKTEAIRLINQAFGKGFSQFDRLGSLKERYRKFKAGQEGFLSVLKGIGRLFQTTEYAMMGAREKGYVYFQDFIPNNDSDTRVIIIGNKAFAIKRSVREGDFRAFGSGNISYNHLEINLDAVKISFEVNKHLKSQSIAFDFVWLNNQPLIVEISYGFAVKVYDSCEGYWDDRLKWHEGSFNPQSWMVQEMIKSLD